MGRRNPNFPGRRLEALGLPRAATEVENMIAALLTFGRDSCRGKVDMVTPIRGENRRLGCWHQHGFMASETIPEKLETLSRVELRDVDWKYLFQVQLYLGRHGRSTDGVPSCVLGAAP